MGEPALERLEKFASTVRETKDYTLRVDHKSDDEIGRLAVAFNEMLSELSAARERESSDQFELARVSRLTTMGAMTASIAHEINQPLAAIAANANAGLRWLSRTTPDIEEVHAALKRINNDAHRATSDDFVDLVLAVDDDADPELLEERRGLVSGVEDRFAGGFALRPLGRGRGLDGRSLTGLQAIM